jgi:hypothetical protein
MNVHPARKERFNQGRCLVGLLSGAGLYAAGRGGHWVRNEGDFRGNQ